VPKLAAGPRGCLPTAAHCGASGLGGQTLADPNRPARLKHAEPSPPPPHWVAAVGAEPFADPASRSRKDPQKGKAMTKLFKTTTLATALTLIALPALAQVTPEGVTQSLAGQGYTDIQVAPEAEGQIATTATNAEGVPVAITYDAVTGQVVSAAVSGQPAAQAPAQSADQSADQAPAEAAPAAVDAPESGGESGG